MVRLDELTIIHAPIERCFDLARSVEIHLAGSQSNGETAVAGVQSGLIELHETVTWRARHFGFWQQLTSGITQLTRPAHFRYEMRQGIFASMVHDHYFRSLPDGATELKDSFEFAAPLWILGLIAERLFLRRYMKNFLAHRNAVIKRIAESGHEWRSYLKCE